VQILVVVARTKIKIFWAEVEKGLTWTVIVCELVDPKQFVKHNLKGIWICKKKKIGNNFFFFSFLKFNFLWKGKRLIFLYHFLDEIPIDGNILKINFKNWQAKIVGRILFSF